MADIQTSTWSETAASNNSAAPDGAPEGMPYASVNDWARETMGAVKREWNRSHPTVASGGTSSAITLTYTTAPPAYVNGAIFTFTVTTTCAANATLNVNALGAKKLYVQGYGATAQVVAGDISAGNVCQACYLSTLDSSAGGFLILGSSMIGRTTQLYMGSNQSVPSGVITTLNGWSNTVIDTLGAWSGGSPSRLTVPAGVSLVQVTLNINWPSLTTGHVSSALVKNTSLERGGFDAFAWGDSRHTIVRTDPVTAGDYYEAIVAQDQGSAANFVGSGDGAFTMTVLR